MRVFAAIVFGLGSVLLGAAAYFWFASQQWLGGTLTALAAILGGTVSILFAVSWVRVQKAKRAQLEK